MEENSQIEQSKKTWIVLCFITCITIAALSWYFRTPTYSLNLVQQAIEQHDLAKFNKHVDTETLLSRGFDDLMESFIKKDDQDTETSQIAMSFVKMMKPTLTASLN